MASLPILDDISSGVSPVVSPLDISGVSPVVSPLIIPDTGMSTKKMWIAGGIFAGLITIGLLLYFVFKKSSDTEPSSPDSPPSSDTGTCNTDRDCIGPNLECKRNRCVTRPTPPPPPPAPVPPPPTPSCSSNAECKVAGTICVDKKCVVPECTTTDDCCLNSDDCSGYFMCSNNKCVCKNGNDMPFCKWRYINFKNQIYDENKKLFSKNARPATYGLQNIYGCLDKCNTDPDCGGVQILQTSSDEIMSATDKVAETNKLATSDGYCYIVGTDPSKALAQSVNAADNNPWVLYYKKQYWPVPD